MIQVTHVSITMNLIKMQVMNQQVAHQDSNALFCVNSQPLNEHVPQSKSTR